MTNEQPLDKTVNLIFNPSIQHNEFSFKDLIEDTPENLKRLLNDLVKTVREDKEGKLSILNPYNPISCSLRPQWWFQSNIPLEYYDQRIAIYQYAIKLVEENRDNYASSKMCEFISDMERHVDECKRYKQELGEVQKRSRWMRRDTPLKIVRINHN